MSVFKQKTINYILMSMLIALSGFPIISANISFYLIIGLVLSILLCNSTLNIKHNYDYFLIFLVICFFQLILVQGTNLTTYIGMFVRIAIAYFIVNKLKFNFYKIYSDIIYYIAILSLILFIPTFISSWFFNLLWNIGIDVIEVGRSSQKSFIFYNILLFDAKRNSGPFWEPGAYGLYLLLALFFEVFFNRSLNTKKVLVFFLAILSTQSTMTLIGLMFLVFCYIIIKVRNVNLRIIILTVSLSVSVLAFISVSFLSDKISSQISDAKDYAKTPNSEYNSQRFISTYVDFKDFLKNPILGTGPSTEARYSNSIVKEDIVRTNGWMDFLVKFGIVGFVLYFWSLYKNIDTYSTLVFNKKIALIFISLIFIIGSSEAIFYYPFFWALSIGINSYNFSLYRKVKKKFLVRSIQSKAENS